jgi:hypothetical protein
MSKRKKQPDSVPGPDLVAAERRRAMREAIAVELECMLGMAVFDDLCDCQTLDDRTYVTRTVSGLISQVRQDS